MAAKKSNIDNRRIAKNTLYMYLRMFVFLGVTLYTARVVIRSLGIDDYGIYNIVGGIVVLFSFINISLKNGFQRFISYGLGKDDINSVHEVIGSSIHLVSLFSLFFLVVSETIGLWFVCYKLNIPEDRLMAALWVYQFSVITFIINLFQTPYQAAVISCEKFSFYAAFSIVDVLLKLLIAFLIVVYKGDRLIFYSGMTVIVNVINLFGTAIYMNHYLKIPYIPKNKNKDRFKSLFSYSGWTMMNSSTVIVAQQGGNILVNLFSGVIANGAYGIANQISAAINGFVSNFQSAFNPQITKSYASGEHDDMFRLINRSCLFSFFLLFLITVPFLLKCDYIIKLWLGENPPFAACFCRLMLIYFLIDAAQAPLWMLISATGNVKVYQIWSGAITLLNIPISAILLYCGFSVYWVFIVRVLLNFICAFIRPFYVKHIVSTFSIKSYIQYCILPILLTISIYGCIQGSLLLFLSINPIMEILIGLTLASISIWNIGISKSDRKIILNVVKKRIGNA